MIRVLDVPIISAIPQTSWRVRPRVFQLVFS
jgi:hypothetical protein